MLPQELMEKYQVVNVWTCSKEETCTAVGFTLAYLGECKDGKWLAVDTDHSWNLNEILILNTRETAMNRLRARGFRTCVTKIYPSKS